MKNSLEPYFKQTTELTEEEAEAIAAYENYFHTERGKFGQQLAAHFDLSLTAVCYSLCANLLSFFVSD